MTQAINPPINTLPIARWSVDEYHRMISAGLLIDRRVELLNGVIVEMPPVEPIHEGRGDNAADHHPYPENIYLLIEIANSRPARDLKIKRQIYAREGIREYWVMDLEKDELRVFRDIEGEGDAADYQADITWASDTIQIQTFPDVVLSLSAMKHLANEP